MTLVTAIRYREKAQSNRKCGCGLITEVPFLFVSEIPHVATPATITRLSRLFTAQHPEPLGHSFMPFFRKVIESGRLPSVEAHLGNSAGAILLTGLWHPAEQV